METDADAVAFTRRMWHVTALARYSVDEARASVVSNVHHVATNTAIVRQFSQRCVFPLVCPAFHRLLAVTCRFAQAMELLLRHPLLDTYQFYVPQLQEFRSCPGFQCVPTINKLRLGHCLHVPTHSPNWDELTAAFGASLLSCLSWHACAMLSPASMRSTRAVVLDASFPECAGHVVSALKAVADFVGLKYSGYAAGTFCCCLLAMKHVWIRARWAFAAWILHSMVCMGRS